MFIINFDFFGIDLSQVPQLMFWKEGLDWAHIGLFLPRLLVFLLVGLLGVLAGGDGGGFLLSEEPTELTEEEKAIVAESNPELAAQAEKAKAQESAKPAEEPAAGDYEEAYAEDEDQTGRSGTSR